MGHCLGTGRVETTEPQAVVPPQKYPQIKYWWLSEQGQTQSKDLYSPCFKAVTVSCPSLLFRVRADAVGTEDGGRRWILNAQQLGPCCSSPLLDFTAFFQPKMKISLISQEFHLCLNMENYIIKRLLHYKLL